LLAAASIKRVKTLMPLFTQLQLSNAPLQLLARIDGEGDLLSPSFVSSSDLQYSSISIGRLVTVWVTSASGKGSPVKGAKVTMLVSESGEETIVGPSCTTGSDGTCTMDLTELEEKERYISDDDYWATVKTDKDFLLVPGAAQTESSYYR
jgi:hypothetical protein